MALGLQERYAQQLRQLLPPGAAFRWPQGGVGDSLLLALAAELVRVHEAGAGMMDAALSEHTIASSDIGDNSLEALLASWGYRGRIEEHVFKPLRAGFRAGARCYAPEWIFVIVCYLAPGQDVGALDELFQDVKQSHVRIMIIEE